MSSTIRTPQVVRNPAAHLPHGHARPHHPRKMYADAPAYPPPTSSSSTLLQTLVDFELGASIALTAVVCGLKMVVASRKRSDGSSAL